MLRIKKSVLTISVVASLSAFSMNSHAEEANTAPVTANLRIPIANLVKSNALPSEFTPWKEFTPHRDHTPWEPSTPSIMASTQGHRGVIFKDSDADVNVPDYSQSRTFTVDEFRMEQKKIEDGRGEVANDGDPIRHERTINKQESRVVTVDNTAWEDTSAVSCTEWNSVGSASRYLTPYTQDAEGQERTCSVEQKRSITLNDPDGTVSYDQMRTYRYIETSTQRGLMDNRSCKTLLDFYNANKSEIASAQPGWNPNGWKRLDVTPSNAYVTYCNNGWTMVAAQRENSPVAWTGGNYQYDLESIYNRGVGFAIPNEVLPIHTRWGVGQNGSVTVGFDSGRYSTGNMHATLYSGGRAYIVHRSTGNHFRWHNPRSDLMSEGQYNNTLTVEDFTGRYGSYYRWAFSPWHSAACSRGYALNGAKYGYVTGQAWTVFVY
ncbi:hypothetical protein NI385_29400 (plasmid) [Vibrio parahaemolyticus]|uniref:hypothetical protein n=4 Tax=Vibrio TaxID=662 RepID=UPI0006A65138|nr:hypothetical protein [Vibrio parahaemolyticus]ARN69880.1 hypothetical protein FORC36_5363 [Vibrio vulnificus]EJG0767208.1 hypothetical protein [Vibrio parahaemolyticus O5:K30]MCS0328424.1 hypothetical protein [Vibrio diabolicus]EGQ8892614.1 hypothetical protein [Vibrio parahaemolyticus]EGR2221738.1 hypothetical protein [Vibrio parahaemolyticus]